MSVLQLGSKVVVDPIKSSRKLGQGGVGNGFELHDSPEMTSNLTLFWSTQTVEPLDGG
jgi:hypothetical protein